MATNLNGANVENDRWKATTAKNYDGRMTFQKNQAQLQFAF